MKNVCGPAQRFDMTSARHCLWKKGPGSFQRLGTVIFYIREQQQQDMLTSQKERSGDQAAAYSAKSKRLVLERRENVFDEHDTAKKGTGKGAPSKNPVKRDTSAEIQYTRKTGKKSFWK